LRASIIIFEPDLHRHAAGSCHNQKASGFRSSIALNPKEYQKKYGKMGLALSSLK
jgi:hypothetical protein